MDNDPKVPRRQFVTAVGAGCLASGVTLAAGCWATARFLCPKVEAEPDAEIDAGPVGPVASLLPGQVSEAGQSAAVWIVRLRGRIIALDATCTHLGCLVAWSGNEARFRCPCHGSSFAADGTNLDGPAPRELDRLAICVRNGRIIIDRNRRFRKQRGQWQHPDSFIAV